MISDGAWINTKNLLFEKNTKIVTAAVELLANLSLTSTLYSKI